MQIKEAANYGCLFLISYYIILNLKIITHHVTMVLYRATFVLIAELGR